MNNLAKLSKEALIIATAKGIELSKNTLSAWDACVSEDIEKGLFTLDDFINAMKVTLRRTSYNRLDYADFYKEAINLSYKNLILKCPLCEQEQTPRNIYGCCGEYSDEKTAVFKQINRIKNEYKLVWGE